MAYVIHIHPGAHGPGRTETFAHSPIRVGRNPLNDLVLEDPMVSQLHGVFRFGGGAVTYVDVGSSNGSLVNGARVVKNEPVPLQNIRTDTVQVGSLILSAGEINLPAEAAAASAAARRTSVFNERRFGSTMFHGKGGPGQGGPAAHPALPPPDQVRIQAAVARAVAQVAPAVESHRAASEQLVYAVRRVLDGLGDAEKSAVLERLAQAAPQIANEPAIEALFEQVGVDAPAISASAAQRFLHLLVEGKDAAPQEARGAVGARRALERIGALVETQSDAFVELRRGYRHFADELGLTGADVYGPLGSPSLDRVGLHRYVFDWSADGGERVEELKRAYADLALHQIALLQGVMAGIRALLEELSPDAIASGQRGLAVRGAGGGGAGGFLGRLFPFARARHWARYAARHREFVEEDRFTRTVFGAAFARAYFSVTGGRG